MFSFEPRRIPAWLAPVCEERSVSHSVSSYPSSASQRAITGALPSRIARRSTGSASPSISRNTIPGTSVTTCSPERRAMRCVTRSMYASSSFVRNSGSRITDAIEATNAAPSAAHHESTVRASGTSSETSTNIAASSDEHEEEPEHERERQPERRQEPAGGSRSGPRSARPRRARRRSPGCRTPGMTQAANSSAAADSTHATSRRTGRMRGRSYLARARALTAPPPRGAGSAQEPVAAALGLLLRALGLLLRRPVRLLLRDLRLRLGVGALDERPATRPAERPDDEHECRRRR